MARNPRQKVRDRVLQRFASGQILLIRHAITPGELRIVKQVARLERVACPRYFVFILSVIRQAIALT